MILKSGGDFTRPVSAMFFLLLLIPVFCGRPHAKAADAVGQVHSDVCSGCHPLLADILPAGHEAVKESDTAPCKECHARNGSARIFEWIAHYRHYAAAGNEISCDACHRPGKEENSATEPQALPPAMAADWKPYIRSWAASGYLDHAHAKGGLTCVSCHGSPYALDTPPPQKCLECHKAYGADEVKENSPAPNPHQSHLQSPPCSLCHKTHEASVNYCNSDGCHNFDFKFPYPNTR